MRKFVLMSLLFLGVYATATAQDARLSQIWSFPAMMNPALVGNTKETVYAGAGVSAMSSKYSQVNHQYAFANTRLESRGPKEGRHFGLGMSYYKYGNASNVIPSPINAKFFSISGAYHLPLSKDGNHRLGIGTQFALASATAIEKGSYYDKEINGGGFRWTDMDSTNIRTNSAGYMDWNLGVNYTYKGEKIDIEAGVGAYHFTHPKIALIRLDRDTELRGRMVFHGKMNLWLSEKKSLQFRNIFWTEGLYWKSTALDQYILTANWAGVEYNNNEAEYMEDFKVNYGLYTRSFKTMMPYISATSGSGLNLRFSYEFPIASNFYQAYTAKRVEVGLHFTINKEKKPRRPADSLKGRKTVVIDSAKIKDSLAKAAIKVPAKVDTVFIQPTIGDKDKDGLNDNVDKCPDQAGPVSNEGCPVVDRDGDGVPDVVDMCPDEKGSIRNKGCPEFKDVNGNGDFSNSEDYYLQGAVRNNLRMDSIQYFTFFDVNSARLTQNSFMLLNKVVEFLKGNNEYRAVISGHGDADGSPEDNMKVSQQRASIVKSYLMSYGLPDTRLTTAWFGKNKPLPIYDKSLLWMNRRVEILLIKIKPQETK